MWQDQYRFDRVSSKWAMDLKKIPVEVRKEIEDNAEKNSFALFDGLAEEKIVKLLQVNPALLKQFEVPQ